MRSGPGRRLRGQVSSVARRHRRIVGPSFRRRPSPSPPPPRTRAAARRSASAAAPERTRMSTRWPPRQQLPAPSPRSPAQAAESARIAASAYEQCSRTANRTAANLPKPPTRPAKSPGDRRHRRADQPGLRRTRRRGGPGGRRRQGHRGPGSEFKTLASQTAKATESTPPGLPPCRAHRDAAGDLGTICESIGRRSREVTSATAAAVEEQAPPTRVFAQSVRAPRARPRRDLPGHRGRDPGREPHEPAQPTASGPGEHCPARRSAPRCRPARRSCPRQVRAA